MKYLRFVVDARDDTSKRRIGLFQIAYDIMRDPLTASGAYDRIRDHIDWFNMHLPEPLRFTKRRVSSGANVALSWFKSTATDHIDKARELAALVESCGHRVSMIKETRIGYVTYEDEYQIVAIPFRDTVA
jgi:hypothetical protein